MDWPTIRIFIGESNRGCKEVYLGRHPCIPRVGEHINVQYKEHKVWRVEHIVGVKGYEVNADIYISEKES